MNAADIVRQLHAEERTVQRRREGGRPLPEHLDALADHFNSRRSK